MNITFANMEWTLRDQGYVLAGPGPNTWSKDNAWVDENGKLHLSIKWNPLYSCWECSQVELNRSLGYGRYRWYIEGFHSRMDDQVILGLYTYDQNAVGEDYREIDIEHGRWGDAEYANSQYVIRPASIIGREDTYKHRYDTTQSGSYLTHEFTWTPNKVHFKSWHGHDTSKTPYYEWEYAENDIPTAGDETTRMNLWLFQGAEPKNKQPHEVIIKHFEFTPM